MKDDVDERKGKTVKSFVLRIDVKAMAAIEAWATAEYRSVNGQLLWIIDEALRKHAEKKKE